MASSPCASAVPGSASPSSDRSAAPLGRRRQRRLIDHRARHRHDVIVLRALHHVARRAIERRPLVSGALSEHVAQAQEDEDRQRQEDDGVDIHVAFAFWSAPATGPAVERSLRRERQSLHHRLGLQHVGTKLGPANGAFGMSLPEMATSHRCQANCSAFWPRGNPILPGNRAYSKFRRAFGRHRRVHCHSCALSAGMPRPGSVVLVE